MAGEVLAASGQISVTAGSAAPIVVSGLPFQPKALFFTWGGRSSAVDVSGVGDYKRGFGVAVSPTSRVCAVAHAFNGETAAFAGHGYSEHDVIFALGFLFGHQVRIDLQSIDVAGFTLIPRFANQLDFRVSYLAWGGSAITDVAVGNLETPTLLGNQDINVGFMPDAIITLHTGANNRAQPIATSVGSELSLGFAAGQNIAQGAWNGANWRIFGPQITRSYCKHNDIFAVQQILAGIPQIGARGRITSWLANGFRVNWATVIGSHRIHYLAIKGGDWFVRSYDTKLNMSPFEIITSRGFPRIPTSSIFVSAGNLQSTTGVVDLHDRMSASVTAGASAQSAHTTFDKANVDPAQVSNGIDHNAIYSRMSEGSVVGVTRITGAHYGGWDAVMDTIDNAENFVLYLASGGELEPKPAELDLAQSIREKQPVIQPALEIDTALGLAPPGRPVMTDSTVVVTVTTPTTTITGLGHLEGALVCAVIDGNCTDTTYTVSSGQITLVTAAQHRVEVGLCYDAELWTMRPAVLGQPVNGLPRHWTKLGLRVRKSHGGLVGFGGNDPTIPIRVGDRSYPSTLLPGELFTGDIDLTGYGETELDGRIKIKVPGPCPFTLLALFGEVEFGAHA